MKTAAEYLDGLTIPPATAQGLTLDVGPWTPDEIAAYRLVGPLSRRGLAKWHREYRQQPAATHRTDGPAQQ